MDIGGVCKDEYIDHLAFILGPHLDLLLVEATSKIHSIPVDIRVIVMPPDCRVLKLISIMEVSLAGKQVEDDGETVITPKLGCPCKFENVSSYQPIRWSRSFGNL